MSNCTRCFSQLSALAVFCPACQQPHAPAFDTLLNQTIAGRYLVQQRLTNGGLSAVFLASDLSTEQSVVLKFSDPQHLTKREMTYALDAETARAYWNEMLERMRHEAEMLLSLRHPHIVRLHDIGTLNAELRYLVLEYLQGTTLHDTLLMRPRLSLAESLRITLALADALEHVHACGIVHRDVNPRNVMLGKENQVKLIDFGIAKFPQPPGAPPFTHHSLLRGTVAYAAPEQCQNQPLDARSDVYSLGVMLYELTTGQRPFAGRTPTEIALQQIQAAPVSPRQLNTELSPDLEAVILRTLAKDPAQRPASAAAFAAELRTAARRIVIALPAAIPVAAAFTEALPPVTVAQTEPFHFASLEQAAKPRRLFPRVVAATAVAAICLAAGVSVLDHQRVARLVAPADFQPLPLETPALNNGTATAQSAEELMAQPSGSAITPPVAGASPEVSTHQADAFEFMTKPLSPSWAASLSARMKLPVMGKSAEAASRYSAKAVVPVVAVNRYQTDASANPPYATIPAPVTATEPWQVASAPSVNFPSVEARTAASISPPLPMPAPNEGPAPRRIAARMDEDDQAEWQPRVIAWNGEVQGERILRIELPGKPGRVEIPRAYRYRVGIVEPPQPGNDWACVRLRVMGKGMVNLVIRWWPR